jgi:hypothetical protein
MLIRKLLLATCVAASLAGVSTAANARVYVTVAPPPVYFEPVPAVRVGYVWIPGFWDWRSNRHHWVAGHYVRHRPGYVYHSARWSHHDGRWGYDRGYWGRGHH